MRKLLLLLVVLCVSGIASAIGHGPGECSWPYCDPIKGPSSAVDEHVPIFDGATGKLLKDSGSYVDADDVTDDNVESMATEGGAGTAPVSVGGNALSMQDIATQAEVNALFSANVPFDAIGTSAYYFNISNTQYSSYDTTTDRPLCISAFEEASDPLGEWTNLDSAISNAPDCNGGGADDGLGICYAPSGWDSYDSVFSSQVTSVDIVFQLSLWSGFWGGATYDPVDPSRGYIFAAVEHAVCDAAPCDTPGESMSMVSPDATDNPTNPQYVVFDGSDWDTGPLGAYANGVSWAPSTYIVRVDMKPGSCVLLYQKARKIEAGAEGTPDTIGAHVWSIYATESVARSDQPYICSFSTSAVLGGRCIDNALVLMTGSGVATLTIDDAPASPKPDCFTVINQGGATLTLTPDASDTIEGEAQGASLFSSTQYDKVQLCNSSDGFWSILGQKGVW